MQTTSAHECAHCNFTLNCCVKIDTNEKIDTTNHKKTLLVHDNHRKIHIIELCDANLEISSNLYRLCMGNCTIMHIGMIFKYQGHTQREFWDGRYQKLMKMREKSHDGV